MSYQHNEALKRAKALQVYSRSQSVAARAPDDSSVDALLARVGARKAGTDRPPPRPVEPAKPAATVFSTEHVRVHMTCSATGKKFVAVAERRGDELRLIGNEAAQGQGSAAAAVGLLSGAYHLETVPGWTCPFCHAGHGARERFWACACTAVNGAIHCAGAPGQARYCACGKLESRDLREAPEGLQVRGQSSGAVTASRAASGYVTPVRGGVPSVIRR
jgi:hypothetical protein